jgi:hypothetical protein
MFTARSCETWRGYSPAPGRRPARDLRAEALRSRTPPPRRCPAPAGRRYRPQRSLSAATARMDRAVLLAPGILSPSKDHRQGRARGRVADAMAQAPPLTLIFHGKNSAPIRRTGAKWGILLAARCRATGRLLQAG